MSKNELVYNEDHMLAIAEKYKNCAEALQSAITYQTDAQTNMSTNYKGMASEIAYDSFGKIKEHIELMVACCEAAGTYVKDSLAEMQELDSGETRNFGGGGGHF